MILQCAQCNARFLVPDTAIGADGRNVRCGRCHTTWFVGGVVAVPDIDAVMREAPPVSTAPHTHSLHVPAVVRAAFPWMAASVVCLLLLTTIGFGLLAFAPKAFGFASSSGLTLRGVVLQASMPGATDEAPHYALNGEIVNETGHAIRAPVLGVSVLSRDNVLLKHWLIVLPQPSVPAHGSVRFSDTAAVIPAQDGLRLRVEAGNRMELALRRLK